MACLESSLNGELVVGGGASGNCFIWNACDGQLLFTWPGMFEMKEDHLYLCLSFICQIAHYRRATVIRFLANDSALATGGDDAIVNVWSLAELLARPIVGKVRQNEPVAKYVSYFL